MTRQLDLALVTRHGLRRAQQAQIRAENAEPGFSTAAMNKIMFYLRANGPTPGETITDWVKFAGIIPPDDRAFGSIFQTLVRRGQIKQVGWCARRKGHGSAGGRVWASVSGGE